VDRVIIGVDPHKKSVTFEARDSREILRATGRFPTDAGGYRLLVTYARQWPDRVWAVEGANGIDLPALGPGTPTALDTGWRELRCARPFPPVRRGQPFSGAAMLVTA
jgi:hypothetical protein